MLFHTSEFQSGIEGDGGCGGMKLGWDWTLEKFVIETLGKLNKQCKRQQCFLEFVKLPRVSFKMFLRTI